MNAVLMVTPEILAQAQALRQGCAYTVRTAQGWLAITGPDRLTWLQGMVSNDTRRLAAGEERLQACVLNPTGHLLADAVLLAVPAGHVLSGIAAGKDAVLCELADGQAPIIAGVLDRFLILEDAVIEDVSERVGSITIQGPLCPDTAEIYRLVGADRVLAVPAEHTGQGGADIYCRAEELDGTVAALAAAGIPPASPDAIELLRIEAGIPRFGADMDVTTIPLEAHLGPTHISLTKGCYVGQEIIARIDARGHTNRALTRLIVESGPLPAPGDRIFAREDTGLRETGRVTSVASQSETAGGKPVALGYVRHEHREPGTRLAVRTDAGDAEASVREPYP